MGKRRTTRSSQKSDDDNAGDTGVTANDTVKQLAEQAFQRLSTMMKLKVAESSADRQLESLDELSSSIKSDGEPGKYLNLPKNPKKPVKLRNVSSAEDLTEKAILNGAFEKQVMAPNVVETKAMKKQRQIKEQKEHDTLGKKWFDLPATTVTPEIAQNLKLLKMRNILDPKRHYKANDSKKAPKYFQIGRVIDDQTDYYTDRVTKKQAKKSLVEQLMEDSNFRKTAKRKFNDIQYTSKQHTRRKGGGKDQKGKKRSRVKFDWNDFQK